MATAVLIFSGYNDRAVIAFLRWASTRPEIQAFIAARDADDPIFKTTYRDRVAFTRTQRNITLEQFQALSDHSQRMGHTDGALILPSSEFLNRYLLTHRDALRAMGLQVPLVNAPLYQKISDKLSFSEMCRAYGLDVPEEIPRPDAFEPLVAKLKVYGTAGTVQQKPYLIDSLAVWRRFLDSENPEHFFFQRLIEGQSHYLLASLRPDAAPLVSAQQNLLQQARGRSVVLARNSDIHASPLAQRYLEMLAAEHFQGLIMIELRHDSRNDRWYMIEANPRLWGPSQWFVDASVDLFGHWLQGWGARISVANNPKSRQTHYFWSGGLMDDAPPTRLNYSADDFIDQYPAIALADLFNRPDTRELYEHELRTARAA